MRLRVLALLVLVAKGASAEPIPPWLEGVWVGQGVLMGANWNSLGPSEVAKLAKASEVIAVQFQNDGFTVSPSWLSDYIEGDGLSASQGSSSLRDDQFELSPPYLSQSKAPTVDASVLRPYLTLSSRHCILNPDHDLPLSDDGHLSPPERSSHCQPVRLFRLAEQQILWPSEYGWIVLERRPPAAPRTRP